MPWGWILCAFLILAGLLLLAGALFHVRVRAGWGGAWESLDSRQEGFFRVEYGFPGFMREWDWSGEEEEEEEDGGRESGVGRERNDDAGTSGAGSTSSRAQNHDASSGTARNPNPRSSSSSPPPPDSRPPTPDARRRTRRDRNRWRRALFRFVTDGKAWRLVFRHGYKTARGAIALLNPRVAIAVGHPDPVKLARFAGYWHASAPLLSASRATLELRFQDRRPTLAIRAEGGFSALSCLFFGIRNASSFPWIGLGRRVWFSWWRHELKGWREWVYERLQG